MKEATDFKITVLNYFSGLPVEQCQKSSKELHNFLCSFIGFKEKIGVRRCMFAPCGKKQYAKRMCPKHYEITRKLINTGVFPKKWNDLLDMMYKFYGRKFRY